MPIALQISVLTQLDLFNPFTLEIMAKESFDLRSEIGNWAQGREQEGSGYIIKWSMVGSSLKRLMRSGNA